MPASAHSTTAAGLWSDLMLFMIYCLDKPNSSLLRMENRPAHFKYIDETVNIIRAGGPILAENNETMIGSLVVVECNSVEDARQWSDNDPYVKAGLFQSREIRPFRWLVSNPYEES